LTRGNPACYSNLGFPDGAHEFKIGGSVTFEGDIALRIVRD